MFAVNSYNKNLLFVGPYPPPYGGIASHLKDVLPALSEMNYKVISLTITHDEQSLHDNKVINLYIKLKKKSIKYLFFIFFNAVRFFGVKKDLAFGRFVRLIAYSTRIVDFIREYEIDAVFLYDNGTCLVVPIIKKLGPKKVKFISFIFGDLYLNSERYKQIPRYIYDSFVQADLVLASSQYCADSVKLVLGVDVPIKIIYVGIGCLNYNPDIDRNIIRNEFMIPEDAIVILFLARMEKIMGLEFLLSMAKKMLALDPRVYLIIGGALGDLSEATKILSDAEKRIIYVSNIPFGKKTYYYAACDIFIAPTLEKHACMGVSIKEAMACGKPIVASTSGGISEAVDDGKNGFLIPFSGGSINEMLFLDRVKALIVNPELRYGMGLAGRQKAIDVFSNDQTVLNYLDVIKKLCNS